MAAHTLQIVSPQDQQGCPHVGVVEEGEEEENREDSESQRSEAHDYS